MQREYMGYVNSALNNGMSAEEVQYLFNDIYNKSNTRQGKRVLRLFSKGIGKAKKNTLMNQTSINQNIQTYEQPKEEKSYQYQYFKQ